MIQYYKMLQNEIGFIYYNNMIKSYLLIFLLVSSVLGQNTVDLKNGQRAILSLSWLGGFCIWAGDCDPKVFQKWDKQSLVIHGFWPDKDYQTQYGDFDLSLFDDSTISLMKQFWPPKRRTSNSNTALWVHQYNERQVEGVMTNNGHGKDYANIYFNLHKKQIQKLPNLKGQVAISNFLQKKYFTDTINLYTSMCKTIKKNKINKNVGPKKLSKDTYKRAQLAEDLGLNQNQFTIQCNFKTKRLMEIKICHLIKQSGIQIVACSINRQDKGCDSQNIILDAWEKSFDNSLVFVPWP